MLLASVNNTCLQTWRVHLTPHSNPISRHSIFKDPLKKFLMMRNPLGIRIKITKDISIRTLMKKSVQKIYYFFCRNTWMVLKTKSRQNYTGITFQKSFKTYFLEEFLMKFVKKCLSIFKKFSILWRNCCSKSGPIIALVIPYLIM